MKALKILDELSCGVDPQIKLGNWGVFFTDEFLSFQEAISELEALQQHIKELELQLTDAHSYFDGVHTVNGAKQ